MILVTSDGISAGAVTGANERDAQDTAYLVNITTVLRLQVLSMRAIIDHDNLQDAGNMLRHARAFERAIGRVGPMDRHAVIDNMIKSCGARHARLPARTVPSVWTGR